MAVTAPHRVSARERAHRERRAQAIAHVLRAIDVDADTAARLDHDGRVNASRLAGLTHPASDLTWRRAVAILAAPTALDEVRAAAAAWHAAHGGTPVIR